jgi:hypothetical protein
MSNIRHQDERHNRHEHGQWSLDWQLARCVCQAALDGDHRVDRQHEQVAFMSASARLTRTTASTNATTYITLAATVRESTSRLTDHPIWPAPRKARIAQSPAGHLRADDGMKVAEYSNNGIRVVYA